MIYCSDKALQSTHIAMTIVIRTQSVAVIAPAHFSSFQVIGVFIHPSERPRGTEASINITIRIWREN
jgi:hypothetical protein